MTTNTDWQGEITKVFHHLQRIGETQLTTGCSMQVHVSPSREGNSYKPEQLHSIMKAIAYFDRAVTAAVPPDRKDNEWAASNFQKGSCAPRYAELYSNMSSLTWGPVFQEFDRIRLPALIPMNVFQNKYVSWNFKHLGSECGTVQFRRPPGVKDARSALYWVAFTLGFLEGAMGHDWSNVKEKKTHGAFHEFQSFIRGGVNRLGPTCGGIMEEIEDVQKEESQPTLATRQEKEVIAAKKREKLDKESNFAVKVSHKPRHLRPTALWPPTKFLAG